MMLKKLILATGAFALVATTKIHSTVAEWTVLTYMQADNDLAPFANYNICDMELAFKSNKPTDKINMLVQWDQPLNTKTWRYKITPNGRVETDSVAAEMGVNPGKEIVDSMKWAAKKFPAKHYALIMWNHGSGIQDLRKIKFDKINTQLISLKIKALTSWIEIPGLPAPSQNNVDDRGILYDDTQHTCLTNPDMASALLQISSPTVLGKKLDLLGMDACLMAMLEVGYQVRNYADVLVASQQTEPGTGWSYDGVLNPLLANPAINSVQFATNIVYAYRNLYAVNADAQDYTQSGIYLNSMSELKTNIDNFILAVAACNSYNSSAIKAAIRTARLKSIEFAISDYIDLYSFYAALLNVINKSKPKSEKIIGDMLAKHKVSTKPNPQYDAAINILKTVLIEGFSKIQKSVFVNAAGPQVSNAKGISIYFPRHGFHSSYAKTFFAKETHWMQFVNTMLKA